MCRQEQEIALFRTACFVVESRPRRPLPKCHPSPPRRFELACCAIATTRAGHRWGGGPDRGRPGGVRGGAAGRERRRGDRGVGPCRAAAGAGTRDAASESDRRGNRADERLARAADAAETCDSWCLVAQRAATLVLRQQHGSDRPFSVPHSIRLDTSPRFGEKLKEGHALHFELLLNT